MTCLVFHACLLLAALATTSPGAAQEARMPAAGILRGAVVDSASGLAVKRASVCVLLPREHVTRPMRCARVGPTGRYEIGGLPSGRLPVSVSCSTIASLGKGLGSDSIAITGSSVLLRDWSVSSEGCDAREIRRVSGTFRGHFTPGFESSDCVPCAADAWFLPGDSLDLYPYDARRAWVEFTGSARRPGRTWPEDAPRDEYGNPRYFVHVRGTVEGPGDYGHMGVSPFELVVDSVLEVRAPGSDDCRKGP